MAPNGSGVGGPGPRGRRRRLSPAQCRRRRPASAQGPTGAAPPQRRTAGAARRAPGARPSPAWRRLAGHPRAGHRRATAIGQGHAAMTRLTLERMFAAGSSALLCHPMRWRLDRHAREGVEADAGPAPRVPARPRSQVRDPPGRPGPVAPFDQRSSWARSIQACFSSSSAMPMRMSWLTGSGSPVRPIRSVIRSVIVSSVAPTFWTVSLTAT